MPVQWEKLARRMDSLIRTGKSALVIEEFERLRKESVPREHVIEMAHLAFRVDANNFGLRILNPIVRSEKKKVGKATDAEKAIYAYGLIRIGAPEEALEILKSIDPEKCPRGKYYQACAHINRAEYADSIPLLESYIQLVDENSYDRIVAETNLVAAYLFEKKSEKAETLLVEVLEKAKAQKLQLVLGKVLQLSAELYLLTQDWELFDEALEKAEKHFRLTAGNDNFFLKKLAFEKALIMDSASAKAGFAEIRNLAIQTQHYESVRDCDRLMAIYAGDVQAFLRVYFGTPSESYRERLLKEFKGQVEIPDHFQWNLTEKAPQECIDLENSGIEIGSLPHRLLAGLCKDFYRPIRIATLHHILYPDEYFNPDSTPLKIHRILQRLREGLSESKMPIAVDESKEFYSVRALRPVSIQVANPAQNVGIVSDPVFRLMKLFGDKPFSVSEGSKAVDVPLRTIARQMKKCLEEGKAERIGNGSAAKYLFRVDRKKAA